MSAAVTIAALSATATTEGFLRVPRQSPRSCDIPFPLGHPNKLGTISLVGNAPEIDLNNEPLCRRGWAFQELFLSPRTLLYSKDQLLWYSPGSGLKTVSDTTSKYRDTIKNILSLMAKGASTVAHLRELLID